MKNVLKLLGIIALVAVIGFSMAACSGGGNDDSGGNTGGNTGGSGGGGGGGGGGNDGSLNGTWNHVNGEWTLIVSGSNYTIKNHGQNSAKGTISYNASTITFKITLGWDGSWVPYSETDTCSYILNGNSITVSGVQGYSTDSSMNGVWTKE